MSKAWNDTENHTQSSIERFAAESGGSLLEEVAAFDEVSIELAPDAGGCGALGCQEGSQLFQTSIDGFGQRVLCPRHVADIVRREVIDA